MFVWKHFWIRLIFNNVEGQTFLIFCVTMFVVRYPLEEFLSAFAKLRKATTSFVMSACLSLCLSVCMEQLSSRSKDFN